MSSIHYYVVDLEDSTAWKCFKSALRYYKQNKYHQHISYFENSALNEMLVLAPLICNSLDIVSIILRAMLHVSGSITLFYGAMPKHFRFRYLWFLYYLQIYL